MDKKSYNRKVTREKIEIGGLAKIAGLGEIDRAVLLGMFLKDYEMHKGYSEVDIKKLYYLGNEKFNERRKMQGLKPKESSDPSFEYWRSEKIESWMAP